MSFPYTPNLQDAKSESLHTQYDYLKLLRLRHLQWRTLADTHDIERTHLEIAELIDQILERYDHLLAERQE